MAAEVNAREHPGQGVFQIGAAVRIGRVLPPPGIHESAGTGSTYADRRSDLENALTWMLASVDFGGMIDPSRIGARGIRWGGYSVLGLAGGWETWRDPRIQAVLAMSPYVKRFWCMNAWRRSTWPVMYQGAQFDLGINSDTARIARRVRGICSAEVLRRTIARQPL